LQRRRPFASGHNAAAHSLRAATAAREGSPDARVVFRFLARGGATSTGWRWPFAFYISWSGGERRCPLPRRRQRQPASGHVEVVDGRHSHSLPSAGSSCSRASGHQILWHGDYCIEHSTTLNRRQNPHACRFREVQPRGNTPRGDGGRQHGGRCNRPHAAVLSDPLRVQEHGYAALRR